MENNVSSVNKEVQPQSLLVSPYNSIPTESNSNFIPFWLNEEICHSNYFLQRITITKQEKKKIIEAQKRPGRCLRDMLNWKFHLL